MEVSLAKSAALCTSPAKNVWFFDARPRDIAKFKMAAIPASFVYSSGKKINCGSIWVVNAYTSFFTYSYGIRSLPCSRFGRFTGFNFDRSSRRTTIFLINSGPLERKAFVLSSMHWRNKTIIWVLWNCLDTWKLFFFFYRKDKAKLCFLQQDFLSIYKKAWT